MATRPAHAAWRLGNTGSGKPQFRARDTCKGARLTLLTPAAHAVCRRAHLGSLYGYDNGTSIQGVRMKRSPRGMVYGAGVAVLLMASMASALSSAASPERPLYKDPAVPVEQRVEDLLARMTLEEKIAQITAVWTQKSELFDAAGQCDPAKRHRLYPAGIGHFTRPNDLKGPSSPLDAPFRDERQTVALVNAIQRDAIQNTRLGIPVLFHEEGLHGYDARGATNFPQAIALASSW